MSTNHTEHYELSQWLSTDQVLRTDFNEDNVKVDAALADLADEVSSKADQAALETLSGRVAQKADTEALLQIQVTIPKLVVGTYVGNGEEGYSYPCTLDFTDTLGRPPQLVLVRTNIDPDRTKSLTLIQGAAVANCYNSSELISNADNTLLWNGNAVSWYGHSASAQMNEEGVLYRYFAIG